MLNAQDAQDGVAEEHDVRVVTTVVEGREVWRPTLTRELFGLLPDSTLAPVIAVHSWGVQLAAPLAPALTFNDIFAFRLCNSANQVIVQCTARVLGLTELELGCEIMLWMIGDTSRFRDAAARIGVRPRASRQHALATPSTRLMTQRVAPRLRSLALEHSRALVRSLKCPSGPAISARLDPERGLLMEWHPDLSSLEAPFEVQVEGPFSTVKFATDSLRWEGPPRPAQATVLRRRQLRRVGVPSGARVLLRGSSGTETISLELPLHDVSFGGVSALLDASAAAYLQTGMEISDVFVTWRGGPSLRFVGEVRHRSPTPRRDSHLLGLRLSGATDDQRERWAREVETLLYPMTRSYGHDYESLWSLYEESGYFDISECVRRTSDFLLVRNGFETAYKKIEAAPHLGCIATYESPTRVEASICGLRAWSRSWFGTQLARNPARPHIAHSDSGPLRDIIFHVYERAGANPDLQWIVHYVRDDAPGFSQVLFRDLVLSVPGACGVPFEVWQLKVTMLGECPPLDVHTASPAHVGIVLEKLRELRPVPYLEAFDLTPETFDQVELRYEWSVHGLERERTMLVTFDDDGKVVAAALLETVEEGLHVYGLLDGVRLFELEPGGRESFTRLIMAANEWFYAMGKSNFVCFDEDGASDIMDSAGGKTMGSAVTTFLPRHATTELLERVSELTVPKSG